MLFNGFPGFYIPFRSLSSFPGSNKLFSSFPISLFCRCSFPISLPSIFC